MEKFKLSCEVIAKIVDGSFSGEPSTFITGLNNIEFADSAQLTFYSDKKFKSFLDSTNASCIIVSTDFDVTPYPAKNFILVDNPYLRFAQILKYLNDKFNQKIHTLHPSAIIGSDSRIGTNVNLGANVVIGANCSIGDSVYINSNVSIYDNVTIGDSTIINSNVVICDDTIIGKNCLILPGAVIGSDGFGFLDNPDGSYTRIPQLGNVVIGDDVEIGANTTIDRALVGSTMVSNGVKLDNLIQIAHNVRVGENTAMAAQAGISGSTHIGRRNRIAGQVGLSGHIELVDDVTILAQSGVARSVEKKGIYFGSPIKERLTAFRIETAINQLPELVNEIRAIKKKVDEISKTEE
jgi:UDP-3-O-[3-hydroxymyristoyl] glucosamine N-acyltransferase